MAPTPKKKVVSSAVHKAVKPAVKHAKYVEAIGRRKTAAVRVRVTEAKHGEGHPGITVNGKKYREYFPLKRQQAIVAAPFMNVSLAEADYVISAHAKGGGTNAQAEALCLGIARALIIIDPTWRTKLKALGYLKRDPRMVESKKFGSRKARRPQQWRKR